MHQIEIAANRPIRTSVEGVCCISSVVISQLSIAEFVSSLGPLNPKPVPLSTLWEDTTHKENKRDILVMH
jgi:hypothetical protein